MSFGGCTSGLRRRDGGGRSNDLTSRKGAIKVVVTPLMLLRSPEGSVPVVHARPIRTSVAGRAIPATWTWGADASSACLRPESPPDALLSSGVGADGATRVTGQTGC